MTTLFPSLLAAGNADLIQIVVIVLVLLLSALGKLLAGMRQAPPPRGGAGMPNPPRPVPPQVADEIGEFLRRAAERRGTQGTRPAAPGQPPPPKPRPLTPMERPVPAEAVAEKPVGGQLTEHVEKYLDEQEFSHREDELGKKVAEADQQIDQHLQQVFSQPVSKLAAVPGEAAVAPVAYEPPDLVGAAADIPDTFATGLLALLAGPDSLRQAIILSEILHRPEERWG